MSALQKSQQLSTPDEEGAIEEIIGEMIVVKLVNGETKIYAEEYILDNLSEG